MAERIAIPSDAKIEIVSRLACFESISSVAKVIKTEFDLDLSPQAIESHDPTKSSGRRLAERWRNLFDETRAKFIADIGAIPIAHKATRIRSLNRMADKAEAMGNLALAARILEQAAKEVGGAFSNKVELSSPDGSMSPPSLADFYGGMRPAVAIFALPDNGRGDGANTKPLIEG